MAALAKIFGLHKKEKPPSKEDALKKLQDMEELLQKKSEFVEAQIEKQLIIAKSNANNNKRVALQALKKKKRLEKQQQEIDGVLTTLEMQREALEGAGVNVMILNTMKMGAEALKKAHKDFDVDSVQDVLDDLADQQGIAMEFREAISSPLPGYSDMDEDDLLQELKDMEQEELNKHLLEVKLPDVSHNVLAESGEVALISPTSKAKKRVTFNFDDEHAAEFAALAM